MLPSFISACLALALTTYAQVQQAAAPSGSQRVWVVKVGSPTNQLVFSPNNIQAQPGEMVQFQYYAMNHSVAASSFDQPCVPLAQSNPTPNLSVSKAFWSGYMPTTEQGQLTYTISITDTQPIYFYCSQGKHCQLGMVGAINAPSTGNTLDAYKAKAAQAPENVTPQGVPSAGMPPPPPAPSGGAGNVGSATSAAPVQATSSAAAAGHMERTSWTYGGAAAALAWFLL